MIETPAVDYGKMRIGMKNLDNVLVNVQELKEAKICQRKKIYTKSAIIKALYRKDIPTLRAISEHFYATNGIYSRFCNYLANLYRYDWYIVPKIFDKSVNSEKVEKEFYRLLDFLDNSHIQQKCLKFGQEIAIHGVYYGYIVPNADSLVIQDLPANYCRSRLKSNDMPIVEFNMSFFDKMFPVDEIRAKVLKTFPKDIQQGYKYYKQQKLVQNFPYDCYDYGWYPLDVNSTVYFNFNGSEVPPFVHAIPAILDLEAAQELDRSKQMQDLLKILVQKLPLDKNGDLIFDPDEAKDVHNNAVDMLGARTIGTDILTTFADIEILDVSDTKSATTKGDNLSRMERTVYNTLGTTQNLFNTSGNLATEKSILNDEGLMRGVVIQFGAFFDRITQILSNGGKKFKFRLYMLETTQYNYKDLAKMYKEQMQMGQSKIMPSVALGHSQSAILHTAYFENEILDLSEVMIPPMSSNTMSADVLNATGAKKNATSSDSEGGRPEKEDSQKSDKTIANRESMGK